jgi:hypothetical protein
MDGDIEEPVLKSIVERIKQEAGISAESPWVGSSIWASCGKSGGGEGIEDGGSRIAN